MPPQRSPNQWAFQDQYLKYFVFANANYNSRTFDLDDQTLIDQVVAETQLGGADGLNPNLQTFVGGGGKLLMYHGWSDPALSPYISVNYYNSVAAVLGSATTNEVRLFMVPGMHHCALSGPGPNTFDTLTPITQWVESGLAPNSMIATHYIDNDPTQAADRTMPLCAYPTLAHYNGGAIDQASSWSCPALAHAAASP